MDWECSCQWRRTLCDAGNHLCDGPDLWRLCLGSPTCGVGSEASRLTRAMISSSTYLLQRDGKEDESRSSGTALTVCYELGQVRYTLMCCCPDYCVWTAEFLCVCNGTWGSESPMFKVPDVPLVCKLEQEMDDGSMPWGEYWPESDQAVVVSPTTSKEWPAVFLGRGCFPPSLVNLSFIITIWWWVLLFILLLNRNMTQLLLGFSLILSLLHWVRFTRHAVEPSTRWSRGIFKSLADLPGSEGSELSETQTANGPC